MGKKPKKRANLVVSDGEVVIVPSDRQAVTIQFQEPAVVDGEDGTGARVAPSPKRRKCLGRRNG